MVIDSTRIYNTYLNTPIFNPRFEMDSKIFSVSSELMKGPGEELFNYIADCLAEFTKEKGINHEILPLGFTFSFPCKQTSLDSGELINWTKGFTCSGVEGETLQLFLWPI